MHPHSLPFAAASLLVGTALAAPAPGPAAVPSLYADGVQELAKRQLTISRYQPVSADCPDTPLVRDATELGSEESDFITSRKEKADAALAAWLEKQGSFGTDSQPTVALASSGGGYRALLSGAGVVKAFDERDSNATVSGLYQAFTYHAGLSGGAWLLSSLAGNDWPTISYLQEELWEDSFDGSLLVPANLLSFSGLTQYGAITTEIAAKEGAGFPTTIIDPWGRLLSYQLLEGAFGGVSTYMSSIATYDNFTEHNAPFPIITAIGVVADEDQCTPPNNATQYEFHPFEFGSWDEGVSAFTPVKYLGSDLNNGQPEEEGKCITQYDNLGYVFGTSSNVFPAACEILSPANGTDDDLANVLEGIISLFHDPVFEDLFALYRNPFYNYTRSSRISDDQDLLLLDGGFSDQVSPIWPFIVDERSVDVLIVNDNSADTDDNFPNGASLRRTYEQAQVAGLTKMPFIPENTTFVEQRLNERATFFGCDEPDTTLMVYLPNREYSFDSGTETLKLAYSKEETRGMIANGEQVGTQDGEEGWGLCLACAIKIREDGLPDGCEACFEKHCYRQEQAQGNATRRA